MNFAPFAGFQALSFVDRINRSEKDRHLCRRDERIRRNPSQDATFFTKSEHTMKLSSPVSTVYVRNAWVFRNINLRTPGSFGMLFTRCGDEVSK